MAIQDEVRGVEEDDLSDLGVEGIHSERGHGGPTVLIGHAELQLDGVRALDEPKELSELLWGQRL